MAASQIMHAGVTRTECIWGDEYVGSAAALIAVGLVDRDQLPGQPGRGKTMCTYYDGRPINQGVSNTPRDERYLRVQRRGKDLFEVRKGLPDGERQRRAGEWRPPSTPGGNAVRSSAPVLRLVDYANGETSQALRAIASRSDGGRVRGGVMVYFRSEDGTENFVFTGQYKTSHAQAVKAAARMMWRLMQLEDDGDW